MNNELDKLRFPIGKYEKPAIITKELIHNYISEIAGFPEKLRKEVAHLNDEQLDTQYRPGGWTIRQVIHHCADSHINAFTRFKLALTEENPLIKPYYEDRWAELSDSRQLDIHPALLMLEGLHQRWIHLLNSLTEQDLERGFIHPEHGNQVLLKENAGIYAWHGAHHLAHITELKKRRNWV